VSVCLSKAAASVWNSLPKTVRASPSLPVSAEDFLSGLTAVLPNERLIADYYVTPLLVSRVLAVLDSLSLSSSS